MFHHTGEAIRAESLLKEAGFTVSVKGPPPDLCTGSDLVIEFRLGSQLKIAELLDGARIAPLKILPLQDLLLEPVGLFQTKDFGDHFMVRAANMKITIDKNDFRIVNISGGGCPDVPFLVESLAGKFLHEAPAPRSVGHTCAATLRTWTRRNSCVDVLVDRQPSLGTISPYMKVIPRSRTGTSVLTSNSFPSAAGPPPFGPRPSSPRKS